MLTTLLCNRYLKDLQKRAQACRSPSAATLPTLATATSTAAREHDQGWHGGSQHSSDHSSGLFSESRTTTHTFNTSPTSRSSLQDEPLCGQKRSNEKAFGINGIAIIDLHMNASPTPPAVASAVQFPQHNALPGSYSGADPGSPLASYPLPSSMPNPNNCSIVGPIAASVSATSHYPQVVTPLSSIWSSTFTIPAKTIRNTYSNNRAWSTYSPCYPNY